MLSLLFLSCTEASHSVSPSPSEEMTIAPPQIQLEERTLLSERLGIAEKAISVLSHQTLRLINGELFLYDEQDLSITSLGFYSEMDAVSTPSEEALVALDGLLYFLEEKELHLIELSLPPISKMESSNAQIWLWGDGRLFYWEGDEIIEVALDDGSFIFDFAAADDRLYLATPWLFELQKDHNGFVITQKWELLVQEIIAETATNTLWLLNSSQQLYSIQQGSLISQSPPEQITKLFGSDPWFAGESTVWKVQGQVWSPQDISPQDLLEVDPHGRLLQTMDGELWRHSIGRPVVITGLSDSLLVTETISVLPSDPESLTSIRAWVNSTALSIAADQTLTLDPDDYEIGEQTLRFFCESELGDTVYEHHFWVGELAEVGWSEVERISQEHCLSCHNGATITNLESKELWIRHIENIIDEVSRESMPLGGPYLSTEEIMTIRGWKQGGFQ